MMPQTLHDVGLAWSYKMLMTAGNQTIISVFLSFELLQHLKWTLS